MFQLQLADTDVSGGSIAVSWCLDQETIAFLASIECTDPQVVLIISPAKESYHKRKEFRKVVPLKDLMTYLEVRYSGENQIRGFISTYDAKGAKTRYLSKSDREYYSTVLYSDGSEYFNPGIEANMSSTSIDIDVPEGAFAPEPSAWEKTWVNHFFRNKTVDQCDFRRRRLFAYGLQPLLFLGSFLVRSSILMIGLLTGARAFSLKYLRLLTYSLGDVSDIWNEGSIFIGPTADFNGTISVSKKLIKTCWALPFMPLFSIPVILFLWLKPMMALLLLLMLAVVIAILLFVAFMYDSEATGFSRFVSGVSDWFVSLLVGKNQPLWYLDKEEMELVVCSDKPVKTFSQLPRKSIRLRFQNVKSKVCRPFSM